MKVMQSGFGTLLAADLKEAHREFWTNVYKAMPFMKLYPAKRKKKRKGGERMKDMEELAALVALAQGILDKVKESGLLKPKPKKKRRARAATTSRESDDLDSPEDE